MQINKKNKPCLISTYYFLKCVWTGVCMCGFFLLAIMNEISCYRQGICSFVSNYTFCSCLRRPSIDLWEEGGRYTWGQGHLIATWEKNDIGPSREICNRAIRRAKGGETKTEGFRPSLTSLITFVILKSACFCNYPWLRIWISICFITDSVQQ